MRKQSVRRGVWRIGGRRQRQQAGGFFVVAGPIIGSLAVLLLI